LSGWPPDPAPPLIRQSLYELAACAPQPWASVLGWRHGVGRLRRTTRTLGGSLGGISNTRPIVLAGCGLLDTRHDIRLRCASPTKRGRRAQAKSQNARVLARTARSSPTRGRIGAERGSGRVPNPPDGAQSTRYAQ